MKTKLTIRNYLKKGCGFLVAGQIVLGCTQSTPSSTLLIAGMNGLTDGADIHDSEENFPTDDYEVIVNQKVDGVTFFDLRQFKGTDENSVRNIKISGPKVDLARTLKALEGISIFFLDVEADEIIINDLIKVPSSSIRLKANKIVFTLSGVINNTPTAYKSSNVSFAPDFGDGKKGLTPGNIEMYARDIHVEGDTSIPRIISNGGDGQAAGKGAAGTNGGTLRSLGNTTLYGQTYDIIFQNEVRYREVICDPVITKGHKDNVWAYEVGNKFDDRSRGVCVRTYLDKLIQKEDGTNSWPQDGTAAKPGGAPGAGGDGGQVAINVETYNGERNLTNLDKIFSVSPGKPGVPAGFYKGGEPAVPKYSAKKIGSFIGKTDQVQHHFEYHESAGGLSYDSPQLPRTSPVFGSINVQSVPKGKLYIPYSAQYYSVKLRYIRDFYLNNQFTEARKHLFMGNQNLSLGIAINSDTSSFAGRYFVLSKQIDSNKDYFGRSLGEAPLYAIDYSVSQFDAEIERAADTYLISSLMIDRNVSLEEKRKQLKNLLESYAKTAEENIALRTDLQRKLQDLDLALRNLKVKEESYMRMIQDEDVRIQKQAEANVEQRRSAERQRGLLKAMVSIAKVVPVGQPALGVGMALLETTLKPSVHILPDVLDYVQNVENGIAAFRDVKGLQKSTQSIEDFLRKIDTNNPDFQNQSVTDQLKYVGGIYKQWAPALSNIKKEYDEWAKIKVSDEEVRQEISEIRRTNPTYKTLTLELESYLADKSTLGRSLDDTTNAIVKLFSTYDVTVQLQAAAGIEFSKIPVDNPIMIELFKNIRNESEDRLLNIYSEVIKAYEYTALEHFPQKNLMGMLREKIRAVFSGEKDVTKTRLIFTSFYKIFLNDVINTLDKKFRSTSPSLYIRTDSLTVSLEKEQIDELNKSGTIEVPVTKDMFLRYQKGIRISDIKLEKTDFILESIIQNSTQKTSILVIHSGFGEIESIDSKKYTFNYANAFNLYTWGSSFQAVNSEIIKTENKFPESMKGILGLLLKDSSNTLLYSSVFTQPAAITKLVVRKESLGPEMQLKQLDLKIQYTYFQ